MKQIILNVEDSAYEQLIGFIRLCPQVELISDGKEVDTKENIDQCVVDAIQEMRKGSAFRHPSDYTYLMMASNQGLVNGLPLFYSPKEFLDYLKELELDSLPGRSTLYDTISKTHGKFPEWTFSDNPTPAETLRRRNVAKQFLSALGRAKRRLSDGNSEIR